MYYVRMYVCVYVCMCVRMYVWIDVCTYGGMYLCALWKTMNYQATACYVDGLCACRYTKAEGRRDERTKDCMYDIRSIVCMDVFLAGWMSVCMSVHILTYIRSPSIHTDIQTYRQTYRVAVRRANLKREQRTDSVRYSTQKAEKRKKKSQEKIGIDFSQSLEQHEWN